MQFTKSGNFFFSERTANGTNTFIRETGIYEAGVYDELLADIKNSGTSIRFYKKNRNLAFDIILNPGEIPEEQIISFSGIDQLTIDREGRLVMNLLPGKAYLSAPICYQIIEGKRIEVECKFILKDTDQLSFSCEAYESSYPLIIDPLIFSDFLTGSSDDEPADMVLDALDNVILCGTTQSVDFPVTFGAYDINLNNASQDVFVSKLSYSGNSLIFSTFIGGSGDDFAHAVRIGNSGNILLAGTTASADFPVSFDALNGSKSGYNDGFILELNANGNQLLYSTFYGGSFNDEIKSIAIDSLQNIYLAGVTNSFDFPVSNGSIQASLSGIYDLFVTRLSPSLDSILSSTFIGNAFNDQFGGMALGPLGEVIISGEHKISSLSSEDVFVLKLNADLSYIMDNLTLSASLNESVNDMCVGNDGSVYMAGTTLSSDFPVNYTAFDTSFSNGNNAYLLKLDTAFNLQMATYFGSNVNIRSIRLDAFDHLGIAGKTMGQLYAAPEMGDSTFNGSINKSDAFFILMKTNLLETVYSTFLGGSDNDEALVFQFNESNFPILAGTSSSTDFPVTSTAFGSPSSTVNNVFISRLYYDFVSVESTLSCYNDSTGHMNLSFIAGASPYYFQWSNGSQSQNISNLAPGIYSCTITDANNHVQTISDTIGTNPETSFLINVQQVACPGENTGAVSIGMSGGQPPYTYSWSNGNTDSYLVGLTAGWYAYTCSDLNGCGYTDSLFISEPMPLVLNDSLVHTSTASSPDGAIYMSVSGGTSPYSFNWSNGQHTEDLQNLIAGLYELTLIDANSCISEYEYQIQEYIPFNIVSYQAVSPLCNGDYNGSVSLDVQGNYQPFTYLWSNGENGSTADSLAAGLYSVVVTDDYGNSTSLNVNLMEPDPLILSVDYESYVCFGDSTQAIIQVTGGIGPYTGFNEDTLWLQPGEYFFEVQDAHACTDSIVVQVNMDDSIFIQANITAASGLNNSDGAIDILPFGGIAPYTYNWSNGSSNEDLADLLSGNFWVEVTDALGCSGSDTVFVPYNLGIEGIDKNQFRMYPNPATTYVNLEYNFLPDKSYRVELYSSKGNKVFVWEAIRPNTEESIRLDLPDLSNGMYFIILKSENERVFIKKLFCQGIK